MKKKKKILLLTGMGVAGLATLTIPAFALVGCATTSNPYAPYTNIGVTILPPNSSSNTPLTTSPIEMSYETNNELNVLNNTGGSEAGINVPFRNDSSTNNKISLGQFSTWAELADSQAGKGPGATLNINGFSTKPTVGTVVNWYNAVNLSADIYNQIQSLEKEMLFYAVEMQPFPFAVNEQIGTQVSQWNNQLSKNWTGAAFTYGIVNGAGVGQDRYYLWPSAVNFAWRVVSNTNKSLLNASASTDLNGTKQVIKKQQSALVATTNKASEETSKSTVNNQPTSFGTSTLGFENIGNPFNPDTVNDDVVEVSNISISYSWFQSAKTGGVWAKNISQVDGVMTSQQKDILSQIWKSTDFPSNKNSKDGFINLTYKFNLGNFDFNVTPQSTTWTPPTNSKTTTDVSLATESTAKPKSVSVYNGQVGINPPSVNTAKSTAKTPDWQVVSNASAFTFAGDHGTPVYNLQNFYSIIENAFPNLLEGGDTKIINKPIYNNVNWIPYNAYLSYWLLGALALTNVTYDQITGQTNPNSTVDAKLPQASQSEINQLKDEYETIIKNKTQINNILLSENNSNAMKSLDHLLGATVNANYQNGVTNFYKMLNISTIVGNNETPNNIFGSSNQGQQFVPQTSAKKNG